MTEKTEAGRECRSVGIKELFEGRVSDLIRFKYGFIFLFNFMFKF